MAWCRTTFDKAAGLKSGASNNSITNTASGHPHQVMWRPSVRHLVPFPRLFGIRSPQHFAPPPQLDSWHAPPKAFAPQLLQHLAAPYQSIWLPLSREFGSP